jgi:arylsulfatase A
VCARNSTRWGIADNRIVIVPSDNGAVPMRDKGEDFGHKSNRDLRDSKGGLYEGGHRKPFLARLPGHAPAGNTNASLVVLADLLAPFADVVGARLRAGAAPDRICALLAFRGTPMKSATRPPVILRSGAGRFGIRRGPWKLICDGQMKPSQLFNLEPDPQEEVEALARELGHAATLLANCRQSRLPTDQRTNLSRSTSTWFCRCAVPRTKQYSI